MRNSLALLLFLIPAMLKAQQYSAETKPKNNNLYSLVGFSIGAGAHAMNFGELNKALRQLDIPKLDPDVGAIEWQLQMGNDFLIASAYFTKIEASQSLAPLRQESRYNFANLSGQYSGGDFSINLVNKQKWQINFPALGVNYSSFQLKADSIFYSPVTSISGLTSRSSSLLILESNGNLNVKAGVEFFYKTGWLKKHVHDIRFGIRTGYILPVKNNNWEVANSKTLVPDLPVLDKGSYYLMFQIIGVMLDLADLNN
jgi:hypothetical protein